MGLEEGGRVAAATQSVPPWSSRPRSHESCLCHREEEGEDAMLEEPPSPCRVAQPLQPCRLRRRQRKPTPPVSQSRVDAPPCSAAIASCHIVTTEPPIRHWRKCLDLPELLAATEAVAGSVRNRSCLIVLFRSTTHTHTLKQKERRNENKERDESRGGSERGRKRRGRSCPHHHHASPPPSLVAVATGAAEPRHRHWGHRAVTVTIGSSSLSVPPRGEFAREGGDVERESCARNGSSVQPSPLLSRVGGCAAKALSPSMESQVCIAIERKSTTLRENQLERGRGVASAASLPSSPSSPLVTAAVSLFSCHSRSCAPSLFCHHWSRHLLGIVYRELLHRTPPSEPSFRCCPLL
ncbi:hypothetical protein Ahy_A01g003331 isoform D [Arachis hypogaea]|uniref:Uncharacterized protein n=1 Tax=Arachis hypogaea TaxID=3818 RepID=A0A445ET54_ARAHY|nr:hypothetical protein Ahy_A01g003331 isoform D [Arachis hypogaea]